MNKITSIVAIFFPLFFCSIVPAHAASFFFETFRTEVARDSTFEVVVYLDAGGENVNAFEGKVVFPTTILSPVSVSDGNSIVNIWIERPETILKEPGAIAFSGVVPAGYPGSRGKLFSVVFKAHTEGIAVLAASSIRALLNDGLGTEAQVTTRGLTLTIRPEGPVQRYELPVDRDPPEHFTVAVSRDPDIFDGNYFVTFLTQDKGVGVAFYEVQEVGWFGGGEWVRAESPYVLRDQALHSTLRVRATDGAGNARIAELPPLVPAPFYTTAVFWLFIMLLITVFVLRKKIRSVRKH